MEGQQPQQRTFRLAMATLADSFLDDLDELGESSDEGEQEEGVGVGEEEEKQEESFQGVKQEEEEAVSGEPLLKKNAAESHAKKPTDVTQVTKLLRSKRFVRLMDQVREAKGAMEVESQQLLQNGEYDHDYDLVVNSNTLTTEIDDDMIAVHRFVVDLYEEKMPELQSIVQQPLDYIRTVMMIGNELDMTRLPLEKILPQTTVMVVSVTASTTNGNQLSQQRLAACLGGCNEYMALHQAKLDILSFVEERMHIIAPNVCALVGSHISAQLTGLAGGIKALAGIPSCNLQVMGRERRHLAGLGKAAAVPHAGLVYYSDVVQSAPSTLRMKASKVCAAKLALAARCDCYGQDKVGLTGQRMLEEIKAKIEKWQEPTNTASKKALPKPDEAPKKKRGGRRARAQKEKFAVTDMRKEANRMGFGDMADEYGDSAMGRDFGMLGKSGSGRIRATAKKESKLGQSKRLKVTSLSGGATNGLASSLVFTPVQGLELVNPNAEAERKVARANANWFSGDSGFASALPKNK